MVNEFPIDDLNMEKLKENALAIGKPFELDLKIVGISVILLDEDKGMQTEYKLHNIVDEEEYEILGLAFFKRKTKEFFEKMPGEFNDTDKEKLKDYGLM